MSAPKYPALDAEQEAAILAFATREGPLWKSALRSAWLRASEPGPLQRLRNTHGPVWLQSFDIGPLWDTARIAAALERIDGGS